MQLVLSNNRVLAHGENFISMGGTVINTETNKVYQNATVAECDGCPSDIDTVGYEYHAGEFVPCAPYGKGKGNVMVACQEDCGTPKDSGIPSEFLQHVLTFALLAEVKPYSRLPEGSKQAITYGNGLFVVVGANYAAYSKDGIKWAAATTPPVGNLRAVAYSPTHNRFVAVGDNGANAYSEDGDTWTTAEQLSSETDAYFIDIVYGEDAEKFVAVASDLGMQRAYSEDGINWSVSEAGGNVHKYVGIAYGNGKFIAVTDKDYKLNCHYSSDGISWTSVNISVAEGVETESEFKGIAFGNGCFVSVNDEYVVHSEDGINWTWVAFENQIKRIGFGNGLFVAVSARTRFIETSPDGITWTEHDTPGNQYATTIANDIAPIYGGDKYVFVSKERTNAWYSFDGETWIEYDVKIMTSDGTDMTEMLATKLKDIHG